MNEEKNKKRHPGETAFLTNPIASATEATGCAPRVVSGDKNETQGSAPVKGVKLPKESKKSR